MKGELEKEILNDENNNRNNLFNKKLFKNNYKNTLNLFLNLKNAHINEIRALNHKNINLNENSDNIRRS